MLLIVRTGRLPVVIDSFMIDSFFTFDMEGIEPLAKSIGAMQAFLRAQRRCKYRRAIRMDKDLR